MSHTTNTAYPYAIFADTPFLIKNEGESIVVTFTRDGSTSGTVKWTHPINSSGCDTTNPLAYNGVVVTIDTTPTDPAKFPVNGSIYVADNTANPDLHAGDKIGSALVVGAFYNSLEIHELTVTDLTPNVAYYVSVHAVDKENRYHNTGVHSYSLEYGNTPQLGNVGFQVVQVGENQTGVLLTDSTGLNPAKMYTIDTKVNFNDYTITIDGSLAQTYEELINQWNVQAALLLSPLESPNPPNLLGLYLDKKNNTLYRWNGNVEEVVPGLYVTSTDPTSIVNGTLAYNKQTSIAYKFSSGSWDSLLTYHTDFAPNDPSCNFTWYDGNTAYNWIGVWAEQVTIVSNVDPSAPVALDCVTYWYNPQDGMLSKYDVKCGKFEHSLAILYPTDPSAPANGTLWMDEKNVKLNTLVSGAWVNDKVVKTDIASTANGEYFFDAQTGELFIKLSNILNPVTDAIVWYQDPLNLKSGTLWWKEDTTELYMWERLSGTWIPQTLSIQSNDPRYPMLEVGTIWINGSNALKWDGGKFNPVRLIESPLPINQYTNDLIWMKPDGSMYLLVMGSWVQQSYVDYNDSLFNFSAGDFWFNPTTDDLFYYDGTSFSLAVYSNKSLKPVKGYTYFNTFINKLHTWNGQSWVDGQPLFKVFLNSKGFIQFETARVGSGSLIQMDYMQYGTDGMYPTGNVSDIFSDMVPAARPLRPVEGSDPVSSKPSYMEMGVGTDGTDDERREMIDSIRFQLGYPQVEVELSKEQMDIALTNAFETFRQRSGMAYNRGFMFIDLQPGTQHYNMTNKRLNHHKIVSVNKIYRVSSSFLSVAQGQGVYGQMALQQMYQMGSFDLVSYHLVGQYVETMNELFAAEIMFKFNPIDRVLSIYKNFFKPERVLMEVSMEKLEQDIIKDRYARQWIQGYAKAQCRMILSEIRGKYASLPGAGGGVSLNSAEMAAKADMEMANLLQELDDYIVNDPENYAGSVMIFA